MIGAIIARSKSRSAMQELNRRDIDAFLKDYSDNAVYIFPGQVSASGTFNGKAAIQAWWQKFLEQFPDYKFDVKNICVGKLFAAGPNNVVAIEWEFPYTNKQGTKGNNNGLTVVDIRGGKITRAQVYIGFDAADQKKAWGE